MTGAKLAIKYDTRVTNTLADYLNYACKSFKVPVPGLLLKRETLTKPPFSVHVSNGKPTKLVLCNF
jgi:hypothetical protein